MNIYEGMFLFEAREKADWEPLREHALGILDRHGAKVLREEKWAERKLAYEIKKARRGIYYLTYFEAPSTSIDPIRRDCAISDQVLRVLILRREELPEEPKPTTEAKEGATAPAGTATAEAKEGEAKDSEGAKPAADAPKTEESKSAESGEGAAPSDGSAEPAAASEDSSGEKPS